MMSSLGHARPVGRECDHCHSVEERTFRDSVTLKDLCLMCLAPIASRLTMSPSDDGDNLEDLLEEDVDNTSGRE